MKTIQGKIPAITIVCLLLMISACQTTSNQVGGVKSDKDLGLNEKALSDKSQLPPHQAEVSGVTIKESSVYSPEGLKKRDIRRSGEKMIHKKQATVTPVTILCSMWKSVLKSTSNNILTN